MENKLPLTETENRIMGGLYGLLVGDALGVPYEFHPAAYIPPSEQIEMEPPAGFRRSHSEVRAGTWSDDGAQALCLLDSLLENGRFSLIDFSCKLLAWYEDGLWLWIIRFSISAFRRLRHYPLSEQAPLPKNAEMSVPTARVTAL